MWRLAAGAVVALLLCPGTARAQGDRGPSPWHVDLEAAYAATEVGFVSQSDVLPTCPSPPCDARDFTLRTIRGTAGIGHAGLTLEASLAVPADGSPRYVAWSAGARADTAWDALLSMFFRVAYVRRWGELESEGARAGLGLSIGPLQMVALFGEASVEVTGVPDPLRASRTLFSWSTHLGGGVRLSFGH